MTHETSESYENAVDVEDSKDKEKLETSLDLLSKKSQNIDKIISIFEKVFDISKKQAILFLKLLKNKDKVCCVNHLTNEMNTGRSTIQKHMNVLLEKGLVVREAKTLREVMEICQTNEEDEEVKYNTNKGYIFVYKAVDMDTLLQMAHNRIDELRSSIETILDTLR